MVDLASIGAVLQGAGALGSLFGGSSGRKEAALQAQYNREVMQNQLQWRAEDAKKAGIHPLYAMGAPSVSFSPSVVGGDSLGDKLVRMGQNVGRAVEAYSDAKTRAITTQQQIKMNELDIKNKEIEVAKNASDLAVKRTGATVPINSNTIIDGQGNAIGVSNRVPLPATTKYVSRTGSIEHYPSQEVAEAIEDNPIYQIEHFYRNRIAPFMHDALDYPSRIGRKIGEHIKRGETWKQRQSRLRKQYGY